MYKVLVANRGEIALRVIRAAQELEWATVAVYTEGDASHATYADEAVKLKSASEYLNVEGIVDIAQRCNCTHVHPGYGFLSESPALAKALSAANITFVGPSLDTLAIASDKLRARVLADELSVPIAPGVSVSNVSDVLAFAERGGVGTPVIIKALDGGGGRGIRVVHSREEVQEAFDRCRRESPSGQLFVEKALIDPGWKHIEVQIIGDGTGEVVHLYERECSVQRRFQKIIEIAPSTLPPSALEPLYSASIKMAHALKYKGLGTFEFLVHAHSKAWVFLEINPRVQVEHTVTEEITGVDLVRTQLQLFTYTHATLASLSLPVRQGARGCAIQLRLTAEDPSRSFTLSPGTINAKDVYWPGGRGVRVDTWLSYGPVNEADGSSESIWTVGPDFDSLLAKIIVSGVTFDETTQRARRVLSETHVGGVKTNADLLRGVLSHGDWAKGAGRVDIEWLERHVEKILELGRRTRLPQARKVAGTSEPVSSTLARASEGVRLQPGSTFRFTLSPSEPASSHCKDTHTHTLTLDTIAHNAFPEHLSGTLHSTLTRDPVHFDFVQAQGVGGSNGDFELADPGNAGHVSAPVAGKVVELHPALVSAEEEKVESGVRVRKGDVLAVLSAMKMESAVSAPADGLLVRVGRSVSVGTVLREGALVCVIRVGAGEPERSRL